MYMTPRSGPGVVPADAGGRPGNAMLLVQPQSPGLADRIRIAISADYASYQPIVALDQLQILGALDQPRSPAP
jgi:hypothetical protein